MFSKSTNRKICSILLLQIIIATTVSSTSIDSIRSDYAGYIMDTKRYDGVYSWATAQVISNESSLRSLRPAISIDPDDNVHLVWQDMTDLGGIGIDEDIFYKVWNTTTEVWSEITVLSPSGTIASHDPEIACDEGGNVHVIWRDNTDTLGAGSDSDVFYRLWNKTTATWSAITLATPQSTSDLYWADLEVKNSIAYVVWQDSMNYLGNGVDEDILLSHRLLNGTWTTAETVSVEGSVNSLYPEIIVDNDYNIHISWMDSANYLGAGIDSDIFYRYKNTTTGVWSTTEVISSSSDLLSDRSAMLMHPDGHRFILWHDNSNILGSGLDMDIFYRIWNATTKVWSDVELLSDESTGNSYVPSLVADSNGNVHVLWFDETDFEGEGVDQDIFYNYWNYTTGEWNEQTIVSVYSTDDSWRPEIAITSEDLLHVVWHDRTLNYGGSGADIDILHSYGPIPIAAPNLSFTNQPLELVFAFESKEQSITWTISDRNVTLPTYTIYQNGTINRTDTWITDIPVFFSLTNLAVANYTIRIEASDGWGEVISNEVLVVIRQATNLWLDPLINSLLGLISAVMAVTVTTLIVIMIRQRKAVK